MYLVFADFDDSIHCNIQHVLEKLYLRNKQLITMTKNFSWSIHLEN